MKEVLYTRNYTFSNNILILNTLIMKAYSTPAATYTPMRFAIFALLFLCLASQVAKADEDCTTFNGNSVATACNSYTWNGNVYTVSGTYTYTSLNSPGCVNTATLALTVNQHSFSSLSITSCDAYTWINNTSYAVSGIYTHTLANDTDCDSVLTLNLTIQRGVNVSVKAMLGGAYDASTGLMKDSLRRVTHCPGAQSGVSGVCPPINVIPMTRMLWPAFNNLTCAGDADTTLGGGNMVVAENMLSVSGPDAIVDWVFVEVRNGGNSNVVVAAKQALIQRDGDIVSCLDGTSPLFFPCVCPGNYYLSVKHRNHLGVMTNQTLELSMSPSYFDFSNPASDVFVKSASLSNSPRQIIGSVAVLWGGDANNNKTSRYNGTNAIQNDRLQILRDLGATISTNDILYQVYKNSDLNMDGMVKYNNAENDKNFLLNLINLSAYPPSPNTVISQHTPN